MSCGSVRRSWAAAAKADPAGRWTAGKIERNRRWPWRRHWQSRTTRTFSLELPHGPAFGDPADGILLLQNLQKPRELAFGALWRIEPRNVGAVNDAVVAQMAQALEILFKGLQPGVTIQAMLHMAPTDRVEAWTDYRGGLDADMDKFRLNAFQEASIKEGLAHVDGTRRYRLKESTTLVGVRMTTPVSPTGAQPAGLVGDAFRRRG